MRVFLLREQRAVLAEKRDDLGVGIEDILAHPRGHADVLGEFAEVIHGREHGQAVCLSGNVVVLAVAGRDVNLASAGVERDEVSSDDLRGARQEWMLRFEADELLTTKLRQAEVKGVAE